MTVLKDRYVLFSVAAVSILILMCAVGSFDTEGTVGNGMMEITGIISDPAASQNGMTFTITDTDGNEFRCFTKLPVPETQSFCRLTGRFSADGNMFFVDTIVAGATR